MKNLYSERSTLLKPWMVIGIVPGIVLFASLAFVQYRQHETVNVYLSVFFMLLTVLLLVFLANHRMRMRMDEEGIHFSYFPYQRKEKYIPWNDIKNARVVTYNPVHDFGGWGYKTSKRYGQGFTTNGNQGLSIEMNNNSKLLLTVQNSEQVNQVLQQRGALLQQ